MTLHVKATIDDLMHVEGKAELVNGEIVYMPATGWASNYAAFQIAMSLNGYVKANKRGYAVSDNAAFKVTLPNRDSFSPDAAYYEGPNPGMRFFTGAPRFAAEVRSLGDYGDAADQAIAAKRADYFAAGTLVVWDVDLLSEDVVRVYRSTDPLNPKIYRRSETAEAEPAVPNWTMPVDDLFEK
jgi:Uma2 family endonuclease